MVDSTANLRQRDVAARFPDVGALLGVSPWAATMRSEILRVAPYECSVVITGPTGTGKELIARAIHRHSSRCHKPLIPVDCAAVSGTLFAGHMFGHVKGAFTGAETATLGCFRAADGGTLLLDEISELEPEFQAKLLRVLQERTVTPLGSHEEIPVDIRIITVTNRDLAKMVSAGQFREDIYFRLNVMALETIPLKDRPEDIAVLAEHFLARLAARNAMPHKQLSNCCLNCMRAHDWPGNIRELENYLERASLLVTDEICLKTFLPHSNCAPGVALPVSESPMPRGQVVGPPVPVGSSSEVVDLSPSWPTLAEIEREHIRRTLQRTQHNQTLAARLLGIPRQKLARKIKQHQLESSRSHPGRPSRQV